MVHILTYLQELEKYKKFKVCYSFRLYQAYISDKIYSVICTMYAIEIYILYTYSYDIMFEKESQRTCSLLTNGKILSAETTI